MKLSLPFALWTDDGGSGNETGPFKYPKSTVGVCIRATARLKDLQDRRQPFQTLRLLFDDDGANFKEKREERGELTRNLLPAVSRSFTGA